MQTLTPEELKIARQLKLQGKSTQDVADYLGGKRVGAPSPLSARMGEEDFGVPVARPQGFAQELAGDVKETFQGFGNVLGEARGTGQRIWGSDATVAQKGAASLAAPLRVAGDLAGEAFLGGAKAILPKELKIKQKMSLWVGLKK